MHPLIKVMLVGGKADGLLVSVADTATEGLRKIEYLQSNPSVNRLG